MKNINLSAVSLFVAFSLFVVAPAHGEDAPVGANDGAILPDIGSDSAVGDAPEMVSPTATPSKTFLPWPWSSSTPAPTPDSIAPDVSPRDSFEAPADPTPTPIQLADVPETSPVVADAPPPALSAEVPASSPSARHAEAREAANSGDFARARAIWEKLAAEGFTPAQVALGRMFARGDGVAKNFQESGKWFSIAAAAGDADAQFFLGQMYEYGDGVPKSSAESKRWYQLSAAQGNSRAQAKVGKRLSR